MDIHATMNVPEHEAAIKVSMEEVLSNMNEFDKQALTLLVLNELTMPEDVIYAFFEEHDFCLDDFIRALPLVDASEWYRRLGRKLKVTE